MTSAFVVPVSGYITRSRFDTRRRRPATSTVCGAAGMPQAKRDAGARVKPWPTAPGSGSLGA
ncbi:hypothetical protein GCM10022219_10070 [Microbacterium oryzae]